MVQNQDKITYVANFVAELQSSQLLFERVMFAFGEHGHVKSHSAEISKANNG